MSVQTLISAIESNDHETALAQFAPAATIHDEGRDWRPAEWLDHIAQFGLRFELLSQSADTLELEASGAFPGSPLTFTWRLELTGGRIAALRI